MITIETGGHTIIIEFVEEGPALRSTKTTADIFRRPVTPPLFDWAVLDLLGFAVGLVRWLFWGFFGALAGMLWAITRKRR